MKNQSSSSTSPIIQASSTNSISEGQVFANLNQLQKPLTPAQIKAQGEVKTKVGVLWLVGAICSILSVFGCVFFIMYPENGKDLWVIIGPIISSALTGTIAFLTGQKQGTKN